MNKIITQTESLKVQTYNVKISQSLRNEQQKGDENSTTFRIWSGKHIGLLAAVTTLLGYKVCSRRRGKVSIESEQL